MRSGHLLEAADDGRTPASGAGDDSKGPGRPRGGEVAPGIGRVAVRLEARGGPAAGRRGGQAAGPTRSTAPEH